MNDFGHLVNWFPLQSGCFNFNPVHWFTEHSAQSLQHPSVLLKVYLRPLHAQKIHLLVARRPPDDGGWVFFQTCSLHSLIITSHQANFTKKFTEAHNITTQILYKNKMAEDCSLLTISPPHHRWYQAIQHLTFLVENRQNRQPELQRRRTPRWAEPGISEKRKHSSSVK